MIKTFLATHTQGLRVAQIAFYCLLFASICTALYFAKMQPTTIDSFQELGNQLRQFSLHFFVECRLSNCASIAIPFLGYLLNLNHTITDYFHLNIAFTALSVWGAMVVIYLNLPPQKSTLLCAWFVFGAYLILPVHHIFMPTAAFASWFLAGLTLIYKKNPVGMVCVIAAYCIDFNLAFLNSALVITLTIVMHSSRFYRKMMVNLLKASFCGVFITHLYLLLIHIRPSETNHPIFNEQWLESLSLQRLSPEILITSLILISFFLYSRYRVYAVLLGLLTSLVVLLQILLYDNQIVPNTIFLTICTFLLLDACNCKKESSFS
jgi:hypothetical protein